MDLQGSSAYSISARPGPSRRAGTSRRASCRGRYSPSCTSRRRCGSPPLELRVHGEIGVVPLAQAAQALELLALHVHIVLGEGVAGVAELGGGHLLVVELLLLDDGALDGHAVVVPAGVVDGVVAAHGLVAGDEVLQALVEGGAHVYHAVGERGAVVQVEYGLALVPLQHLVVEVHVVPLFEHIGLALGQRGAHGKVCFRQVHRGIVVLSHCLSVSLSSKNVYKSAAGPRSPRAPP